MMLSADIMSDPSAVAALAAARTGIWRWDLAANCLSLSPQSVNLLGAPSARLSRQQFLALVHDDDLSTMRRSLDECLAIGRTHDLDFRTAQGAWLRMCGCAPSVGQAAEGLLETVGPPR
jgi:PAS domain-containing protein